MGRVRTLLDGEVRRRPQDQPGGGWSEEGLSITTPGATLTSFEVGYSRIAGEARVDFAVGSSSAGPFIVLPAVYRYQGTSASFSPESLFYDKWRCQDRRWLTADPHGPSPDKPQARHRRQPSGPTSWSTVQRHHAGIPGRGARALCDYAGNAHRYRRVFWAPAGVRVRYDVRHGGLRVPRSNGQLTSHGYDALSRLRARPTPISPLTRW
jgi:hypothetical protein